MSDCRVKRPDHQKAHRLRVSPLSLSMVTDCSVRCRSSIPHVMWLMSSHVESVFVSILNPVASTLSTNPWPRHAGVNTPPPPRSTSSSRSVRAASARNTAVTRGLSTLESLKASWIRRSPLTSVHASVEPRAAESGLARPLPTVWRAHGPILNLVLLRLLCLRALARLVHKLLG